MILEEITSRKQFPYNQSLLPHLPVFSSELPHYQEGLFSMASQLTVEPHPYERLLIVLEHCQRIERIARKQTRGTTIAWEDAAQVAQLKVLQAVREGKFRQGGAVEFYRWAATVARFEIIDLIRKEKYRHGVSLDAAIPGTDLLLSDTIPDEFNALDSLERTDLVLRSLEAIRELDQRCPERSYLELWQGQVQGKKQTQLAMELGLSQGEVSKRWKELVGKVAEALGLLHSETIQQERQSARKRQVERRRSTTQW